MSAKGIWFAFGVGVVAGATVALLYAPQTGVRTRKQLRRGVEEAGDYLENAGEYLKDQAERLTREASRAYKKGLSQVDDYVDTARGAAKSASKTVSSLI